MIALFSRIAIALMVAAVVLQSAEKSDAQSCKADRQGSCLQAGATCSPVDPPFSGTQGSCRTINPQRERECICGPAAAPPPPPPQQTGIVGNVLTQPTYVNLYWDATWDADNPTMPKDALDGFTTALVKSSYFGGLAEYGVTSASYAGGFLPHGNCTQKAPGSVGFYAPVGPSIIGFLQCELDNDHQIPQGSQVVYNIILPSGSLESDAFGLKSFCTGGTSATAWHFHQRLDSPEAEAALALIALGGGDALTGAAIVAAIALLPGGPVYTIQSADSRCGKLIKNLVHEMVEATTDPFPPFSVIRTGEGEIGDMCEHAPSSTPFVPPFSALAAKTSFPQSRRFTTSALISVPSYWSNANQVCLNLTGETPKGAFVGHPGLSRRTIIPLNPPIGVATTGNGANISFTFSGQGFGTLPGGTSVPAANLPYLAIQDNTQPWQAGNSLNGDAVSLTITSWSDTSITASGLGFSSEHNLVMKPNDNFAAWICNPSSGNCGKVSWSLQEPGTPQLNLLVVNSVPLHFDVLVDGNAVASHTGGGFTGWQALAPGTHTITETATDPGIFRPNFFGACGPNGQITLHPGDNQICTVLNAFNTGCASGQHCCGSVGKFGCSPACVSNSVTCNPICPINAQNLNKCCGSQTATGECDGQCIKSPPQSCN